MPDGEAGTRATLKVMASLVRRYRKNIAVRSLALDIVRPVSGHKNFRAMAAALCNWVRNNVQYVRDVNDVETLQTPLKTLDLMQGDCDDQSTLLAALLEAVGFHTRFTAIKTSTFGPFIHVLAEAQLGRNTWMPLETTEPWEPGTFPVSIAGVMYEEV